MISHSWISKVQSHVCGFLASEFHDIRASRVVRMRKCTKHARYILKFREYLARAVSPRPCGNAQLRETHRDSLFFLFFFRDATNSMQISRSAVHITPRADCSLSRLITGFARNSDVIHESSGWNFRNAAGYSASVLPYAFRVTERCEPFVHDSPNVIEKFYLWENKFRRAIAQRDIKIIALQGISKSLCCVPVFLNISLFLLNDDFSKQFKVIYRLLPVYYYFVIHSCAITDGLRKTYQNPNPNSVIKWQDLNSRYI